MSVKVGDGGESYPKLKPSGYIIMRDIFHSCFDVPLRGLVWRGIIIIVVLKLGKSKMDEEQEG